MGHIAAIILSGGYSSRMGDFKPLLNVGDDVVVERVVRSFLHAGIDDIIVVLGHRAEEVMLYTKKMGVEYVVNEGFDQGMFSSVKRGIGLLKNKEIDAFFFTPVDYPLIKSKTILDIKKAYSENKEAIIYPCFNGERGHPPIIAKKYIEKILNHDGEGGLRKLLNQYEDHAIELEVKDPFILMDMDTKADYEKILKYAGLEKNLNRKKCMEILNQFNVSEKVVRHSDRVAEVAGHLGFLLNKAGMDLDIEIIKSAGLLHDIAKGKPHHAKISEEIVRSLGYEVVSKIIGQHMNMDFFDEGHIREAEIVYLADKLVKEDQLIPLEIRCKKSFEKYSDQPEVMINVKERFDKARSIKDSIEKKLEINIETLLATTSSKRAGL